MAIVRKTRHKDYHMYESAHAVDRLPKTKARDMRGFLEEVEMGPDGEVYIFDAVQQGQQFKGTMIPKHRLGDFDRAFERLGGTRPSDDFGECCKALFSLMTRR